MTAVPRSEIAPLTVNLDGRVALVTGAGGGMGASHAQALAANGASVALTDIDGEQAQYRAAEVGARTVGLEHDVTSPDSWLAAIEETEARFGPVSILVNNAGVVLYRPLADMTPNDYSTVVEVNQTGTFLGMCAVIPSMQRAGRGSIINVSSTAGVVGFPGLMGYVASKWAIRGMSKAAAIELAPHRIRVNTICPGVVDTPMTSDLEGDGASLLHRRGRPEEVSSLVLYLASDASAYCTGGDFVIDGGETASGPGAAAKHMSS